MENRCTQLGVFKCFFYYAVLCIFVFVSCVQGMELYALQSNQQSPYFSNATTPCLCTYYIQVVNPPNSSQAPSSCSFSTSLGCTVSSQFNDTNQLLRIELNNKLDTSGEVSIALTYLDGSSQPETKVYLKEQPTVPLRYSCSSFPSSEILNIGSTNNKIISRDTSYSIGGNMYGYIKLKTKGSSLIVPPGYFSTNQDVLEQWIYNENYWYRVQTKTLNLNTVELLKESSFAFDLTVGSQFSFYFPNPYSQREYSQKIDVFDLQVKNSGIGNVYSVLDLSLEKGIIPIMNQAMIPMEGKNTYFSAFFYQGVFSIGIYNGSFSIVLNSGVTNEVGDVLNLPTIKVKSSLEDYYVSNIEFQNAVPFSFTYITSTISVPYIYPFGLVGMNISTEGQIYRIPQLRDPLNSYFFIINTYPVATVSESSLVSLADNVIPIIKSVSIIQMPLVGKNQVKNILRINALDELSGVSHIAVTFSFETIYIDASDLVGGNKNDAIYEKDIGRYHRDSFFSLNVFDFNLNSHFYTPSELCFMFGVGLPLSHMTFSFEDIKEFYFQYPEMTKSGGKNTAYLSLKQNMDSLYLTIYSFKIVFMFNLQNTQVSYGVFNPASNQYEFDINVPANLMFGNIKYEIYANDAKTEISNESILGKNNTVKLAIVSQEFDQFFPTIYSLVPQTTVFQGDSFTVSWLVEIKDYSGLKDANFTMIGDYDQLGYTLNIKPQDMIGGNTQKSEYRVSYTIKEKCRNMKYYFSVIETMDQLGNYGKYVRKENITLSPYFRFDWKFNDAIEVVCPTQDTDLTIPELKNVKVLTPSLNTRSSNRIGTAVFSVEDLGSGVSQRHIPSCYFHTTPYKHLGVQAVITAQSNSLISYSCSIEFPYGWGADSFIILSIYGISDNNYNYVGYSAADLESKFFIDARSSNMDQPIISDISGYIQSDTRMIVYGYNFISTGMKIIVKNTTSTFETTPTFISNTAILMDASLMTTDFTIQVSKPSLGVVSNVFNVACVRCIKEDSSDQVTIPPVTPTCRSDCGVPQGYGKCVNGACVCNPPHSGIDCKAKTDNTTVITPDPVKPSVNLTIPGTNSGQTPEFISFVSVVAIREVDNTDSLINNYVFNSDKWILVKEGSSSNEQVTTVQYKYVIDTYNTTIVSTVQVFEKETNITFGNQQLYMNPSTIKFTFNITSYPFSKSTNSLQIVMNAALQSTEKVACSYKEFVDDQNNSQYLKIQIEDRSLFGRFIKFGMIDGREQVVSNSLLDNIYGGKELSKSTSDQSYIGLNIPYYTKYALLDPDFSVLVEQNTARDQANSICTNESKKLTNAQLAGIIVGGVVFLFIIGAVAIYFFTKKSDSTFALKLRKIAK